MAVLSFPIDPRHGGLIRPYSLTRVKFRPVSRDYASPLIDYVQSEEIPGATYLTFRAGYRGLEDDALSAMEAFADAMRGKIGRVAYGDPLNLRWGNRGPGGGAPKVQSPNQVGRSLNLYDADPSIVGWLRRGDYVSWSEGNYREIHRLQVDADSSAAGEVTLNFMPPIRRSPPVETPIVTQGATTTMGFTSDDMGEIGYSLAPVRRGAVTLEFIERPVEP